MRNPRTTTTTPGGGGSTSSSTSSMEKSSSMNNNNNNINNNKKMTPCCSKVGIKRGPWTPEEDEVLAKYINKEGEGRWRTLPKRAGLLRCGKSCRLRWMNYLRPSVKRGHIAPDEEDLILRLHRLLGNRWSLIAGRIPGRTDNEIKNYWNTHLSKKLISQGIDPRTHKPLLLNPSPNSAPTTPHHNINKLPSKTIINSTNNTPPPILSNPNPNPNPKPNGPTPYMITDVQPPDDDHHFQIQINNKEENGYLFHANNNDDGIQTEYPNYYPISSALPCADDDDHQDMNCCSDDIFSSFLNSLINDDAFAAQHQHQLHQVSDPNFIANTTTTPPPYGCWDSALLSSTTTATFNNHNNHHPNGPITDVDDQIE